MIIKFSFLGSEYSFDKAKYVVIPVVDNIDRAAAIEVIKQSLQLPGYNRRYGIEYNSIPVYTHDIVIPDNLEELNFVIRNVISRSKIPILVGPDHSITISTIGLFDNYLIIDAHPDMYDEYRGSKYNHACVAKRLREYTENVYHYGVRISEPVEVGWKPYNGKIDKLYLSIDMDVLDPKYIDTNVLVPAGMDYDELLKFIWTLENKKIVGVDVVEILPERKSAYLVADLIANILAMLESNH